MDKRFRKLLLIALVLCYSNAFTQLSAKISTKAAEALTYCQANKLNTTFCFLIDMSVHSGKNRFYVYNFKSKTITNSGLVCHGMGKTTTEAKPVFSNENGSNCTSLGKYKTGKRAYSNWGIHIHYKMIGLESSNSNAFKRQIVLHSYFEVPSKEIYPKHLSLGWSKGCPVVDDVLMKQLDKLLKNSKKPTLIWIFE